MSAKRKSWKLRELNRRLESGKIRVLAEPEGKVGGETEKEEKSNKQMYVEKIDTVNIEHLPAHLLYNCSGCLVGQRGRGFKKMHTTTEMMLCCHCNEFKHSNPEFKFP